MCCHNAWPLMSLPVLSHQGSGVPLTLRNSPGSGTAWSKMGQFLSSTFLEGSPATVWQDKCYESEHMGAGEVVPVLQDQVMYLEDRKLITTLQKMHDVWISQTQTCCHKERVVLQNAGGVGRLGGVMVPPPVGCGQK